MSLITRCPACQTLYKVVPDQLRISEGWVRCGNCDEIFDASLHLLPELASEPQILEPDAEPVPESVPEPVSETTLEFQPAVSDSEDAATTDDLPIWMEQDPSELPVQDLEPQLPELAVPEVEISEFVQPTTPEFLASSSPDAPQGLDEAAFAPSADGSEPAPVSFMGDSDQVSSWAKPPVRMALYLCTLILVLGLAFQVIIQERDQIAAREPRAKPWLMALCAPLKCTVSPLRRIESIAIDSSSFARIGGNSYRLKFVLKNSAAIALAAPAMELTLTDSLDQPVLRRVFLPSDLGASSDALAAGAEWSASVAVALQTVDPVDRVLGYRLLAFYP